MKLENGMRSFFFFFFIIFFTLQPFSSLNHGYVFGERERCGMEKDDEADNTNAYASKCVCVWRKMVRSSYRSRHARQQKKLTENAHRP